MLEPRRADVPLLFLFLFLVVLPVVVYILLGKWSESSKRNQRINLLVEQAAVRSPPEPMVTANVVPVVPPVTHAFRECARCRAPASTRCSRCKSVRYCSGKCQIIHWRQGHKDDCRPSDNMNSSLRLDTIEEAGLQKDFSHEGSYPEFNVHTAEQPMQERVHSHVSYSPINSCVSSAGVESVADFATVNGSWNSVTERRVSEKRVMLKSTKEMLDCKDTMRTVSSHGKRRSTTNLSKEPCTQHMNGDGPINTTNGISDEYIHGCVVANDCIDGWGTLNQSCGIKNQNDGAPSMNGPSDGSSYIEDLQHKKSSPEMMSTNVIIGSQVRRNDECVMKTKSPKPMSKAAREQINLAKARKGHGLDESAAGMSNSFAQSGNGTSSGLMKVMGLKKPSKISKRDISEMGTGGHLKVKVLFPYEEFTRFFEQEVFNLAPRGLLNCGNSCYANAVLQCLTCTKPLITYLLSRTHSRACSVNDWCLLCELEQHVLMLKEAGGPLSPSRILSYIRRINCQIGDGSQEDAHEFLRLLVASMQSICLEEAGGESQVHPSSQETTFVQQTFGGRLRSLVICLRCHHESERYENIMDLTLEIFGWVESLEDALTQFTTPEDLDGENMYRCGRCASYVRARKQLSIDEAPNILTIVLKRFQEGSYGKINKCISFPEMLDMIPFMTGTNDIPPLYMLYGVVVHVDTLNASFSGHYVSYVKDLQGNWFRIDDSMVQPVHVSQVMSEGAYILFYRRSYPRAPRDFYIRKTTRKQAANPSRQAVLKAQKSSQIGRNIHRTNSFTHAEVIGMESSDVTSSDWSLFTSSDDASFTSESTRDSFSATDYSDPCKIDPFCSKFSPTQRTISCRMFSGSQQVTRYVTEQQGYIFDSANPINPVNDALVVANLSQVSLPFNEGFQSDNDYQNFVNYETSPSDSFIRTFSNCQL